MKNNYLNEGDVFELTKGMRVKVTMPERFVYSNRRLSNTLCESAVTIGDILVCTFAAKKNAKKELIANILACNDALQKEDVEGLIEKTFSATNMDEEMINTNHLKGEYVVTKAEMEGGGTGHGPHDVFPDGHLVLAKRLNSNGKFDPDGKEISFYQSGSFNTTNNVDIPVIRAMKKIYG